MVNLRNYYILMNLILIFNFDCHFRVFHTCIALIGSKGIMFAGRLSGCLLSDYLSVH